MGTELVIVLLTSVGAAILISLATSTLRRKEREVRHLLLAQELQGRLEKAVQRLQALDASVAKTLLEKKIHPNIMLLHTGSQAELARKLAEDLEEAGGKVWLAESHLKVGDSIEKSTTQALEESDWVIVLVSPDAQNSKWFNWELDHALSQEQERDRKLLLPALASGDWIPDELRDRVYVDLSRNYEEALRQFESVLFRLNKPQGVGHTGGEEQD